MNEGTSPGLALGAALIALGLFVVEFLLSVLLHAIQALSRIALRSLEAEIGRRRGPLEALRSPASPLRVAVETARQGCLLGGCASSAIAASWAGIGPAWAVGFLLAILVAVLAEGVVARLVAVRNPKASLRATLPLGFAAATLLRPVVLPFGRLWEAARRASEPAAERPEREQQDEEVEAFIEVGEREGILEAGEGEMVRGIVDLGDTKVREIMTPRTDIVAIPASSTVLEARRAFLRSGHSRLPVYEGTVDNVVGILHVRDVLAAWEEPGSPISNRLRPAFFVPETRTVAQLLEEMRLKTHLALVVDEYGSLAGLVTVEDLVEEIVGEIREEHEAEEPLRVEEADGRWVFSGVAHVEDLERTFGLNVGERGYDTVGGFVIASLGRVPAVGEILEVHGLRIEILEATRRRVHRVRIWRVGAGEKPPAPTVS